jgi:hypothetical protein
MCDLLQASSFPYDFMIIASSEPGSTLMSSQGTGLRTRRVVILSRSSPKSEREDDARE